MESYVSLESLRPYITDANMEKIRALEIDVRGLLVYCYPYFAGDNGGNVSLYARGKDYHEVVKSKLEQEIGVLRVRYQGAAFLPFADSSPFPEVMAAVMAGLGVLGKNRLLITPRYGSYVFIGVVATDLEVSVSAREAGACIGCGKCISACPGKALSGNGVDLSRCLSDITQRKGELTETEAQLVASCGTLWGCDICQKVCPMNAGREQTDIVEFRQNLICSLKAEDIPQTKKELQSKYPDRAFTWRGSAPLLRNARIIEK